MADSVFLGLRLQSDKYERIKLENIDLENKVSELKKTAAEKVNLLTQNIEFIYCGLILDDTWSLASCGIKPGVTIHVLEKPRPPRPAEDSPLTEQYVQRLVTAFRAFGLSSEYGPILERLSTPDVLAKIMAATPGLSDDPVALSIIGDPELVLQFSDPDTVRRAFELHPALVAAASHIIAYVHQESGDLRLDHPSTSTSDLHTIEGLSDDDEDDEMESPSEGAIPLSRNSSYNIITAAQLAAAIANASNSTPNSSGNNTASTPTGSGNLITTDMFNSAMLSAMGSGTGADIGTGSSTSGASAVEAHFRHLQPQLDQMWEMGLVNNSVNIRALQTTSGDVQAAVELVLSGAFD